MNPLTVGVAIITFNGLKYLPQQLDSIVTQSYPVDHIVISDDRSTDGTWEFLQTWAKLTSIRVTLIRNEKQLGLSRNFEQAISAVETDIIFTSDQDDVWVTDRVRLMIQIFEKNPDVLLVHTDAALVDSEGHDMGKTLLRELELSRSERKAIHAGSAFSVYCRRNVVTGATAAIRHSLLRTALPLPANYYHDCWLALIASAAGEVRLLDCPTIHYRQHGKNLVGVKKLGPWMEFRHLLWRMKGRDQLGQVVSDNIYSHKILRDRLLNYAGMSLSAIKFASESLTFYNNRAALPSHSLYRAIVVMRAVLNGDYRKYSYSPHSDAIRDIFRK